MAMLNIQRVYMLFWLLREPQNPIAYHHFPHCPLKIIKYWGLFPTACSDFRHTSDSEMRTCFSLKRVAKDPQYGSFIDLIVSVT